VTGDLVLASGHETPVSTVNDGELDAIADMPSESPWPIALALAVTIAFVFLLTTHYATAAAFFALGALTLVGWHSGESGSVAGGVRPGGWWGMAVFVATEATLFGTLVGTYVYLSFHAQHWGHPRPPVLTPVLLTAALVLTSIPMQVAWRAAQDGLRIRSWRALLAAFAVQCFYLVWQLHDYAGQWRHGDSYTSIVTTMTGIDHLHVLLGIVLVGWLLVRLSVGVTSYRLIGLRAATFYWHAVNTITIVVLAVELSTWL
jgi:heme/copper-type cytochrome/quinol oxidase subunit 3